MAFDSLNDFFTMCYVAPIGDIRCHGAYVWSAYGLTALVIAWNITTPILRNRQIKQAIRRKLRREKIQNESKA